MSLSDDHVDNVCGLGDKKLTCAFLSNDLNGWSCIKGTALEGTIRQRLAEGTMGAQGDNCSGPPDFKPNDVQ